MTPLEKQQWWQRTLTALEQRDPRVQAALLTALILRHGTLEQCSAGHTHVYERITLEELLHVVKDYHLATRIPEFGVVEVQAIPKEDVHGTPPNPGERDPFTGRTT